MSKTAYGETQDRIIAKRKELQETQAILSMYFGMMLSDRTVAAIRVLQDRLEFRVAQYEEALLDDKIKIYKEAVAAAKKDKNVK